jgi:tetratricopeptide (TPR) repeat protein
VLRQGNYAAARTLFEASLARYEELGHPPGIATIQYTLGVLAFRRGEYAAARARYAASLARYRELGDKHGMANALAELASVLNELGEDGPQAALLEEMLQESLALYREVGAKSGVAVVLSHLAMNAWAKGEYERAETRLSESLALYRAVENRRGIARVLGQQGLVAYARRDYAPAAALCRESVTLHRAVGETWEIGRYLWVLGAAMSGLGQPDRAARLFGAAARVRERLGAPLPPVFRPSHDAAVAALRAALGERAFASAWAEGQALSVDEAIDR